MVRAALIVGPREVVLAGAVPERLYVSIVPGGQPTVRSEGERRAP